MKLKVVMNAHLNDKAVPVDQFLSDDLFDILCKYNALVSSENLTVTEPGYSFFHDYGSVGYKYLDLHQKWPRPGAKSLEKFLSGNKGYKALLLLNLFSFKYLRIYSIENTEKEKE